MNSAMSRGLLCAMAIVATILSAGCAPGMVSEREMSPNNDSIDSIRFSMHTETYVEDTTGNSPKLVKHEAKNMTADMKRYYPNVFSDRYDSLPIYVMQKCQIEFVVGSGGCHASIYLASVPSFDSGEFSYSRVPLAENNWAITLTGERATATIAKNVVEYVKKLDVAKLKAAYAYRKERLKKVDIHGNDFWVFVGFDGDFDQAKTVSLLFWNHNPATFERPVTSAIGARKENGIWHSEESLLTKFPVEDALFFAKARLKDGMPYGVSIREAKPRIEYLIELNNSTDPEEIHWSNRLLIKAKNTTFLDDLRRMDRASLASLQTKLETELLNLNERISKLRLQMQNKLVNKQNTKLETTLIPLYEQRVTLFEALLASLKQAYRHK